MIGAVSGVGKAGFHFHNACCRYTAAAVWISLYVNTIETAVVNTLLTVAKLWVKMYG